MFNRARKAGLPIALHCGETKKNNDDPREMISFGPERLGHCVYLNDDNMQRLENSNIPVETCFTCHDKIFGVPYSDNIFGKLHPRRQVVLATDNPSFYGTTLSKEFEICAKYHKLTVGDLFDLARRSIDVAFIPSAEREKLYNQFDEQIGLLKKKYNMV